MVQLILLCLTISYLTACLYYRFHREIYNIPLDCLHIERYFTYLHKLYIIAFLILIFISIAVLSKIVLSVILKKAENTYNSKKKENMFIAALGKVVIWLEKYNFLLKTYSILFDFLGPQYTHHLLTIAKMWVCYTKKNLFIIICIFTILPRSIILLIFLLEIYFGQLHYYFYALLLLLIPMLFQFFLFMLKDFGFRVLPEIQKLLIFNEPETIEIETAFGLKKLTYGGFQLAPEHADLNLSLVLTNFYNPLVNIIKHMTNITMPLYSNMQLISLFIYYLIHFFGLSYIFIYYYF